MKAWAWVALVAVVLALLGGMGYALFALGGTAQKAKTVAADVKATGEAQTKANTETRATIARANKAGHAREQGRQAIDTFFQQLDREARDAPSSAADSYVLPDDRLRLWRQANAGGPDTGAAAGQPHDGAASSAAAADRANPGPGGEPPGSGPGVSPARDADVQPAGLPADST